MANINQELLKIKTAVYGEEVRDSIHDAIYKINHVAEIAVTEATGFKDSAAFYSQKSQTSATTATKKAQEAEVSSEVSAQKAQESTDSATIATLKAKETSDNLIIIQQVVENANTSIANQVSDGILNINTYIEDNKANLKGDKGDIGETGPKGDTGLTGDIGPKGDKGDKGEKGDKGIQGKQGDKGDKGDKGDGISVAGAFNTLDELNIAFPAGDGINSYIVSGYLYIWNETAWINVGKIQGDKGDKGEQGIQGTQGIKGDKGEKGDKGDSYNDTQIKSDIANLNTNKADKIKSYTATILADGWQADNTQIIDISNMVDDGLPLYDLVIITDENLDEFAKIIELETMLGKIKLTVKEPTTKSIDIRIEVVY